MASDLTSFTLLVEATGLATDPATSLVLCGRRWRLVEYGRLADAPPFTCVSYSWGAGRTRHPLAQGEEMSDRTLPVLETAIAATQSRTCWGDALLRPPHVEASHLQALEGAMQAAQAIWIDFFCLPSEPVAKQRWVRSMGCIYRAAAQVVAVLLPPCAQAFKKVRDRTPLQHDDLLALERDDWVARAWTYQEIVVSQTIYFAAEGEAILLTHLDLLNAIGTGTIDVARAQGTARQLLIEQFPRLDGLQDVFVELQIIEYAGQPVFQMLGAMVNRLARDEADLIHAVLGVVTGEAAEASASDGVSAAAYFMLACEKRNDFSYLFTTGPRDTQPGRTWRPLGGPFRPVVSGVAAFGDGLSAELKDTHLELYGMRLMRQGVHGEGVSASVVFAESRAPAEIAQQLGRHGYTGAGDCITLESGYFFPQQPLQPRPARNDWVVAICPEVRFAQGAPGLLLAPQADGMHRFLDVGVFIGPIIGPAIEPLATGGVTVKMH